MEERRKHQLSGGWTEDHVVLEEPAGSCSQPLDLTQVETIYIRLSQKCVDMTTEQTSSVRFKYSGSLIHFLCFSDTNSKKLKNCSTSLKPGPALPTMHQWLDVFWTTWY